MQNRAVELQRQARDIFLGREGVVGVGVTHEEPLELAFLLRESSPHIIAAIEDWATAVHTHVSFQTVGRIRG